MGLGSEVRRRVLVSWPRCIYHSAARQPLTVEHVIPKYWFRELYGARFATEAAVDDPLHLFPAGRRANMARGHAGLHFVAVPDESKGVLARSIQQMIVRYPEIYDIAPFVLVPELYEEWLLRPVCKAEMRRAVLLSGAW